MIVKISKGNDPGNLMKYLVGPGKQNEHTRPHAVAGSLGGIGPELSEADAFHMAEDLRSPQRLFGTEVKGGHMWHASLAIGADEGKLSDQTWSAVANDFMRDMGFTDPSKSPVRWTAVHHGMSSKGNDHIHIAMSLVREDGTKVSTWQDMVKASKVVGKLETKYGLKQVTGRTDDISPQPYSKNDGGRAKDQNTDPRRQQIEVKVRAAATASKTEAEFVANLTKQGLRFKAKRDVNDKVIGYSVNLPETITKGGVEHWWAGSKLARDLSLPRLRQQWEAKPLQRPTQAAALRELKTIATAAPTATTTELATSAHQVAGALAVAAKHDPALAVKAREIGKVAQTKTFTRKASPPALSVAMLMLAVQDPSGPAAQAVMIRQLLATMSAVMDAHRARTQPARRIRAMAGEDPSDELVESGMTLGVTVGARLLEQHARGKEAEAHVQTDANKASSPSRSTGYSVSSRQGQLTEDDPNAPRKEAGDVVTITASGMSKEQQAKLAATFNDRDPEFWKTGHEPRSGKQAYTLEQRGINPDGATKAEASLVIGGKARSIDEARELISQKMAMSAPEASLTPAPTITTTQRKHGRGR